jgi:hypothetical protein
VAGVFLVLGLRRPVRGIAWWSGTGWFSRSRDTYESLFTLPATSKVWARRMGSVGERLLSV